MSESEQNNAGFNLTRETYLFWAKRNPSAPQKWHPKLLRRPAIVMKFIPWLEEKGNEFRIKQFGSAAPRELTEVDQLDFMEFLYESEPLHFVEYQPKQSQA